MKRAEFEWLAKPAQPTDWTTEGTNDWEHPALDPLRSDPRFAPLEARGRRDKCLVDR